MTLPPTAPQAALPPDCAAKFAVEGLIASGGFGIVYRARQIALDRTVAVKLLLDHALSDDIAVGRFMNEARATASIEHASVIRVIDHGAEHGIPWIAYEYLPGRNLRQILDSGPMALDRALLIAGQVADALEVAHQKGILHRDIKPDNVIEAETDRFKVADFGIARFSRGSSVHTQTGTFVGTVGYVAPEIICGDEPGAPADLYALGAMLFEMATGQVPFADDHPIKALSRHVSEPAPSARERREGVPAALDALILRLLSKKPADRPAAAAEVSELLARLRAVGPVGEGAPVLTDPLDVTRPGRTSSTVSRPVSRISRAGSRSRPDGPMRTIAALTAGTDVAPPERRRVLTVALAVGIAAGIAGILAWRAAIPARDDRTAATTPTPPASASAAPAAADIRALLVDLVTGPSRFGGSAEAATRRVETLRAALTACVARVRAAPAGPHHKLDRAAGLALTYVLRAESRLASDLGARAGDDSERTAAALATLIPAPLATGTAEDAKAADEALAALAKLLRVTRPSDGLAKSVAEILARLGTRGAGLRWTATAPHVKSLDYISEIARRYRRTSPESADAVRPLAAWFESLEAATDDPVYWEQRANFLSHLGKADVPPDVPIRWAAALLVRHVRHKGKLDADTARELARALEVLKELLHEPPFEGLMRDFERTKTESDMDRRRERHHVAAGTYFSAARTLRTKLRAGAWPLGAPLGSALADLGLRAAAGAPAAPAADLTARSGDWCTPLLILRGFEMSVLVHGGGDDDRERLKRLMAPHLARAIAGTRMWHTPIDDREWLETMYPHRSMPETITLLEPELAEIRARVGW